MFRPYRALAIAINIFLPYYRNLRPSFSLSGPIHQLVTNVAYLPLQTSPKVGGLKCYYNTPLEGIRMVEGRICVIKKELQRSDTMVEKRYGKIESPVGGERVA